MCLVTSTLTLCRWKWRWRWSWFNVSLCVGPLLVETLDKLVLKCLDFLHIQNRIISEKAYHDIPQQTSTCTINWDHTDWNVTGTTQINYAHLSRVGNSGHHSWILYTTSPCSFTYMRTRYREHINWRQCVRCTLNKLCWQHGDKKWTL